MPRTAAQSLTGGPQTAEAITARYREAIARGAAAVRAQAGMGDASRSSMKDTARPGAEGEAGRGSAEDAARPDAEEDAGRGSAEDAA